MSPSPDDATATWQLEWYVSGHQRPVPEGVTVTAQLYDGRISGNGGCNRYFGPYRESDGRVEIGPLATTQMMCGEEAMEVEAQYLALLGAVSDLRIEGGLLRMEIEGETVLEFARIEPPIGTRRMCAEPEGVMLQERRYLEVLTEVKSYSFSDNGVLELFDAAGARLLQFGRA